MPPRASQTEKTNFEKITRFFESEVYSKHQDKYPNKYIFDSLEDSAIQKINDDELIKTLFASRSIRSIQVALIKAASHVNFFNRRPIQAYCESEGCQERRHKREEIDDELNFFMQCKKIEFHLGRKEFKSASSELAELSKTSAKIQGSNLKSLPAGRYTEYFTAFSGHVNRQISAMKKRIGAQKEYKIFQRQEMEPRIFGRYKTFLDVETIQNNNLVLLARGPQFDRLDFSTPEGHVPIYQQMLKVKNGKTIEVDGAEYQKKSSSQQDTSFCRFVSGSGEIIFRENGEDGTSQVFCFGAGQREFVQKIVAEVRNLHPSRGIPAPPKPHRRRQVILDTDIELYGKLADFLGAADLGDYASPSDAIKSIEVEGKRYSVIKKSDGIIVLAAGNSEVSVSNPPDGAGVGRKISVSFEGFPAGYDHSELVVKINSQIEGVLSAATISTPAVLDPDNDGQVILGATAGDGVRVAATTTAPDATRGDLETMLLSATDKLPLAPEDSEYDIPVSKVIELEGEIFYIRRFEIDGIEKVDFNKPGDSSKKITLTITRGEVPSITATYSGFTDVDDYVAPVVAGSAQSVHDSAIKQVINALANERFRDLRPAGSSSPTVPSRPSRESAKSGSDDLVEKYFINFKHALPEIRRLIVKQYFAAYQINISLSEARARIGEHLIEIRDRLSDLGVNTDQILKYCTSRASSPPPVFGKIKGSAWISYNAHLLEYCADHQEQFFDDLGEILQFDRIDRMTPKGINRFRFSVLKLMEAISSVRVPEGYPEGFDPFSYYAYYAGASNAQILAENMSHIQQELLNPMIAELLPPAKTVDLTNKLHSSLSKSYIGLISDIFSIYSPQTFSSSERDKQKKVIGSLFRFRGSIKDAVIEMKKIDESKKESQELTEEIFGAMLEFAKYAGFIDTALKGRLKEDMISNIAKIDDSGLVIDKEDVAARRGLLKAALIAYGSTGGDLDAATKEYFELAKSSYECHIDNATDLAALIEASFAEDRDHLLHIGTSNAAALSLVREKVKQHIESSLGSLHKKAAATPIQQEPSYALPKEGAFERFCTAAERSLSPEEFLDRFISSYAPNLKQKIRQGDAIKVDDGRQSFTVDAFISEVQGYYDKFLRVYGRAESLTAEAQDIKGLFMEKYCSDNPYTFRALPALPPAGGSARPDVASGRQIPRDADGMLMTYDDLAKRVFLYMVNNTLSVLDDSRSSPKVTFDSDSANMVVMIGSEKLLVKSEGQDQISVGFASGVRPIDAIFMKNLYAKIESKLAEKEIKGGAVGEHFARLEANTIAMRKKAAARQGKFADIASTLVDGNSSPPLESMTEEGGSLYADFGAMRAGSPPPTEDELLLLKRVCLAAIESEGGKVEFAIDQGDLNFLMIELCQEGGEVKIKIGDDKEFGFGSLDTTKCDIYGGNIKDYLSKGLLFEIANISNDAANVIFNEVYADWLFLPHCVRSDRVRLIASEASKRQGLIAGFSASPHAALPLASNYLMNDQVDLSKEADRGQSFIVSGTKNPEDMFAKVNAILAQIRMVRVRPNSNVELSNLRNLVAGIYCDKVENPDISINDALSSIANEADRSAVKSEILAFHHQVQGMNLDSLPFITKLTDDSQSLIANHLKISFIKAYSALMQAAISTASKEDIDSAIGEVNQMLSTYALDSPESQIDQPEDTMVAIRDGLIGRLQGLFPSLPDVVKIQLEAIKAQELHEQAQKTPVVPFGGDTSGVNIDITEASVNEMVCKAEIKNLGGNIPGLFTPQRPDSPLDAMSSCNLHPEIAEVFKGCLIDKGPQDKSYDNISFSFGSTDIKMIDSRVLQNMDNPHKNFANALQTIIELQNFLENNLPAFLKEIPSYGTYLERAMVLVPSIENAAIKGGNHQGGQLPEYSKDLNQSFASIASLDPRSDEKFNSDQAYIQQYRDILKRSVEAMDKIDPPGKSYHQYDYKQLKEYFSIAGAKLKHQVLQSDFSNALQQAMSKAEEGAKSFAASGSAMEVPGHSSVMDGRESPGSASLTTESVAASDLGGSFSQRDQSGNTVTSTPAVGGSQNAKSEAKRFGGDLSPVLDHSLGGLRNSQPDTKSASHDPLASAGRTSASFGSDKGGRRVHFAEPPTENADIVPEDEQEIPRSPSPKDPVREMVQTIGTPGGSGSAVHRAPDEAEAEITLDEIKSILQYLSAENKGRGPGKSKKSGIFASKQVKKALSGLKIFDRLGFIGDATLTLTVSTEEDTRFSKVSEVGDEELKQFHMTMLAFNLLHEVRNLAENFTTRIQAAQDLQSSAAINAILARQSADDMGPVPGADFTMSQIGILQGRLLGKAKVLQQVMNDLNLNYNPDDRVTTSSQGTKYTTYEVFAGDTDNLSDYIQKAGEFVKKQIKDPNFQQLKQSFLRYQSAQMPEVLEEAAALDRVGPEQAEEALIAELDALTAGGAIIDEAARDGAEIVAGGGASPDELRVDAPYPPQRDDKLFLNSSQLTKVKKSLAAAFKDLNKMPNAESCYDSDSDPVTVSSGGKRSRSKAGEVLKLKVAAVEGGSPNKGLLAQYNNVATLFNLTCHIISGHDVTKNDLVQAYNNLPRQFRKSDAEEDVAVDDLLARSKQELKAAIKSKDFQYWHKAASDQFVSKTKIDKLPVQTQMQTINQLIMSLGVGDITPTGLKENQKASILKYLPPHIKPRFIVVGAIQQKLNDCENIATLNAEANRILDTFFQRKDGGDEPMVLLNEMMKTRVDELKDVIKGLVQDVSASADEVRAQPVVHESQIQAEIDAAKFLVNYDPKDSALYQEHPQPVLNKPLRAPDQEHPNSFMQSLYENNANPSPATPYRGIGVKSDLVMLGAPEDSNYALQISDVFSADEDPWNKRFSGVENIDELNGALITQIKIGDVFVAISQIIQDNGVPNSLSVIAQAFHAQGNVEFIINEGDEERNIICNNSIDKTAIYAPTPSNRDTIPDETSDFRALSQMLGRAGTYQEHAEKLIRECVDRQPSVQQQEELTRQPSRSPSPALLQRTESKTSLHSTSSASSYGTWV